MKYLLGLILLVSVSASAQYSPTAAKTRFVNGIGLGTKDTLTMNAADTVAMIVGRDSLVYFRYKGYWKPLAYNSSLTGYVPYTGATGSVNLGSYNLTANKIAIGGSISAVALDVHRAGSIVARIENTNSSQDALFAYAQSAQNVWFTGIDYASGANNFGFYYTPDGTTVIRKAYFSNSGDLTANSFIKSGGTSSQFLKADGSVTTIIPSGSIDTGRAVTAIATGGSLNKVRDSLQANIGLKLNISDTATMLSGYKTYYPRAALSAGTGITYNASTGVITNSSPSTGGTVTSVATNTGSGITGGTITSSGTIAADTSVLSTKANVTASLTSKVSSVSATSPIASSGGLTPTISISQSSGSTNGYLSSTDWNTFNNKGSGSVTSIATDATMTGGTITTSGTLKVDTSIMATRLRVQKGIDSLGAAKQGNITLTTTGTSGAATFSSNTLNIPQYQAAGTYVTSVTGTSPIVSSGGTTPAISIPAATTSVNGYLTSTDWTTFNNKQSALTNPVTGTGTTNYLPKFTGTSTIGNSAITDDGTTVTLISRALSVTAIASGIQPLIHAKGGGDGSGMGKGNFRTSDQGGANYFDFGRDNLGTGNFVLTSGGGSPLLSITTTGAATFSSSVTATSLSINTSGQARTFTTFYGAGSDGNNIFIGGGGLSSGTGGGASYLGSYNTANGFQALYYNTTGNNNTANGVSALYYNTTGYSNTANGVSALQSNTTGYSNTANGFNALLYNTTGNNNTANGVNALYSNTTGYQNTANGFQAGYGTGTNANTTGSNNIFIGNLSVGVSATESNRTWIGNSSTTSTWLAGNVLIGTTTDAGFKLDVNGTLRATGAATFSSTVTATGFFESSDRRLKNIISRSNDMVTFKWKQGDTLLHYGYIAQEVEKVMPDQVKTDEKGMKSVNYIEVLVKKINDLENRIKQLEK